MKYQTGLLILIAAAASAIIYWQLSSNEVADQPNETAGGEPLVSIALPTDFSDSATVGRRVFDAKCAACHGKNAVGQNGVAPPLIHPIYEPDHHADEAFQRAAALGVPSHHWPFGDMPPVEGVSRADINNVVAYIREIQRTNGID